MYRSNRGFTLIELLVVITIIGVLVALIIPAVNMVREESRQTKCLNNQMQIAKAILDYEVSKRHLPGVINVSGGTQTIQNQPVLIQYSWATALLPYLDRNDLFQADAKGLIDSEYIQFNASTLPSLQLAAEQVKVFICPDDPRVAQNATSSQAPGPPTGFVSPGCAMISYGVNDGFFVSYANHPNIQDRLGNKVAPASSSNLKSRTGTPFPRGEPVSASTTIMIGERTAADAAGNMAGRWTDTAQTVSPKSPIPSGFPWTTLAFPWPVQTGFTAQPATLAVPISPNIMVSSHPGKVVVVFFDCHGAKILNDAIYPQ